jgi:hypothetical protein
MEKCQACKRKKTSCDKPFVTGKEKTFISANKNKKRAFVYLSLCRIARKESLPVSHLSHAMKEEYK